MEELPVPHEPQVPQPNGIPKINPQRPPTHIYDTICIGFGALGLGLAVALSDLTLDTFGGTLFIERSPSFSSNSKSNNKNGSQYMHTTFAQDLATLRCPTSPYTFLNYLSEKQSLETFLTSSNSLHPTRKEFESYLQWAAAQFSDVAMYGEEVLNVERKGGKGNIWIVTMRNIRTGEKRSSGCRNVAFATGREARVARNGDGMEEMREVCLRGNGKNEDRMFDGLAVHSGRVAASLIFGNERGNSARAAL
jgi:lysine/ornithine N-monooxygenase